MHELMNLSNKVSHFINFNSGILEYCEGNIFASPFIALIIPWNLEGGGERETNHLNFEFLTNARVFSWDIAVLVTT